MESLIATIHPQSILEISGDYWSGRSSYYDTVSFPAFDICEQAPHRRYDMIIAEQVWEHLLYPRRAAINVMKALYPGGWFLVATPFLLRIHKGPIDCTRWTETGLRYFLADAGFPLETIRTWSWGNRQVVTHCLDLDFPEYNPSEHSLENDDRFPYHVWALARNAL